MSIKYESTVIITDKLDEMKNFYTNVLGQSIKMDFGNCIAFECGLSLFRLTQDYPIAKALGTTYHDTKNKNLELCFETDDFEKDVKRLKSYGMELLHDVSEEVWGQLTIRGFDPDKNLVELGESMSCFCKRLYSKGLCEQEVAKKTGIPIDIVKQFLLN